MPEHCHTTASSASFPTVFWGKNRVTYQRAEDAPPEHWPRTAALVFAIWQGEFVVGDIAGRGWCIPGGHLEPGETPEQAVRREAHEETGATLGPLTLIGFYLLTHQETDETQVVPTYLAHVTEWRAVPSGTESHGTQSLRFEELPQHYFLWDALLEAVFTYARDVWQAEGALGQAP
jgi:8-oxo-dGTP pyrophosphatase MutT (NUDIX family)